MINIYGDFQEQSPPLLASQERQQLQDAALGIHNEAFQSLPDPRDYEAWTDMDKMNTNVFPTLEERQIERARRVRQHELDSSLESQYPLLVGAVTAGAAFTSVGLLPALSMGVAAMVLDTYAIQPLTEMVGRKSPELGIVVGLTLGVVSGIGPETLFGNSVKRLLAAGKAVKTQQITAKQVMTQLAKDNPLTITEQFVKEQDTLLKRIELGEEEATSQLYTNISKAIRQAEKTTEKEYIDAIRLANAEEVAQKIETKIEAKIATGVSLESDDIDALSTLTKVQTTQKYVKTFTKTQRNIINGLTEKGYDAEPVSDLLTRIKFHPDELKKMMLDEHMMAKRKLKKIEPEFDFAISELKKRFPEFFSTTKTMSVKELLEAAPEFEKVSDMVAAILRSPTKAQFRRYVMKTTSTEFDQIFVSGLAERSSGKEVDFWNKLFGKKLIVKGITHAKRTIAFKKKDVALLLDEAGGERRAIRELTAVSIKAAQRALKDGDTAVYQAQREAAHTALDEWKRFNQYRQKVLLLRTQLAHHIDYKNVAPGYQEQIFSLVRPMLGKKYGLHRQVAKPTQNVRDFLIGRTQDLKDFGAELLLKQHEDIVHLSQRAKLNKLTFEELEKLESFIAGMVYVGRKVELVKVGTSRTQIDALTQMVQANLYSTHKARQVAKSLKEELKEVRTPWNAFTSKLAQGSTTLAALRRMEPIVREADGFKHMGVLWRSVFKRAVNAQALENKTAKILFDRYQSIFDKYKNAVGHTSTAKYFAEDVGQLQTKSGGLSITREKAIAMALNMGSSDNSKILIASLKTDKDTLTNFLSTALTKADRQLVDDVWDMLDEQWGMLEGTYRKLTGLSLQKVPGRYYMIAKHRQQTLQDEPISDLLDILIGNDQRQSSRRVRDYMLKTRTGGVQRLHLDLDVIAQHLRDTAKVVSHAEVVMDVNKIFTNKQFRQTIRDNMGNHTLKEMEYWLRDLAKPTPVAFGFLRNLRMNTTIVCLGLKPITGVKQSLSMLTAMPSVGYRNVIKGAYTQLHRRLDNSDILQLSQEMAYRSQTWQREMAEYAASYDPKNTSLIPRNVKTAFFSIIHWVDRFTASSVWRGAYDQGLTKFSRYSKEAQKIAAADYADLIVRETQPASAMKDLPRFMRTRNEGVRALGMFQGFFNVNLNQIDMLVRQGLWDTGFTKTQGAAALGFMFISTALAQETAERGFAMLRGKDTKETRLTEADFLTDVFQRGVMQATGGIPIGRDLIAHAMLGYDVQVTPLVGALTSITDLGKIPFADDWDYKNVVKPTIEASGYLLGYPSKQLVTTLEGAIRMVSGSTSDPTELLIKR